MTNRLPLAPNSTWDGAAILEPDGTRIQALTRTPEPLLILFQLHEDSAMTIRAMIQREP